MTTCGFTINSSPNLQSTPKWAGNAGLNIQRLPRGTGGDSDDTPSALYVHTIAPVGDKYSETNAQFILDNYEVSKGSQNVALSANAYRKVDNGGSIWGGVIAVTDNGKRNNPAFGLDGLEVDAKSPDNTTDRNQVRTILKLVNSGFGGKGTHTAFGLQIGNYYANDVIDTGICFAASCAHGLGKLGIGIDFSGNDFVTAGIRFSALDSKSIVWTDTRGTYDGLSAGMAIGADTDNNFNIDNFSNAGTQFRTAGRINMLKLTSQYAQFRTLNTAQLATCTRPRAGSIAFVSDSTSRTIGDGIIGGGRFFAEAFCDGKSWTVAAASGTPGEGARGTYFEDRAIASVITSFVFDAGMRNVEVGTRTTPLPDGVVAALPPCVKAIKGRIYGLKKKDASRNTVILTAATENKETQKADLIDGVANVILNTQYAHVSVQCNGAGDWDKDLY